MRNGENYGAGRESGGSCLRYDVQERPESLEVILNLGSEWTGREKSPALGWGPEEQQEGQGGWSRGRRGEG